MELLSFLIVYLFFKFDIALLKKRALPIFESVFHFSSWQTLGMALLLILALLKTGESGFAMVQILFVLLLTIYLLRRVRFLNSVKSSSEYALVQDENLQLALSALSIIGFWVLGMAAISILVEAVENILGRKLDELASLLIFSEISVVFFVVLIYRAVRFCKGVKLFEVLSLDTKGLGWVKIWVLPAVFALAYAILTSRFLDARPIQPLTPLQDILNSTNSAVLLLIFAASAILTAPFFEEIIFRGFFFTLLQRFKGSFFAVIFVALVFGALHVEQYWGDWDAIVVVGLFGLSLTILRLYSGSAVPGMIAHYVYNSCLIIVPVLTVIFSNPIYLDYQLNVYRLTDAQKEERLLKSIEQYPQFSEAYNDLAWIYSEQGIHLDRALEFIDKALSLEPQNYAFLDTKAEVLFKMGRKQEAIAIEEGLMKKYPHDPQLRQQLEKFRGGKLFKDKSKVSL